MSSEQVYVIAEAGVNHNGDVNRAHDLVEIAAQAEADAVKFQTFSAEKLVTRQTHQAPYQSSKSSRTQSQYELLQALELDQRDFLSLSEHARHLGIDFLSTAFDEHSLTFLVDEVGINVIKIPSGEATNIPYILHCARRRMPIILSTGMCDLDDVRLAVDAIAYGYLVDEPPTNLADIENFRNSQDAQDVLIENLTLLQCTSEYPVPIERVNLSTLTTLRDEFRCPVGFSDHSQGIVMAIASVALGATVVEKHFTTDRSLSGPDHLSSLEPPELHDMITSIRQVEIGLGSPIKTLTRFEQQNALVSRRSLVAARQIEKGAVITPEALEIKRSGGGISPKYYWEILGSRAHRDYERDDPIAWASSLKIDTEASQG